MLYALREGIRNGRGVELRTVYLARVKVAGMGGPLPTIVILSSSPEISRSSNIIVDVVPGLTISPFTLFSPTIIHFPVILSLIP